MTVDAMTVGRRLAWLTGLGRLSLGGLFLLAGPLLPAGLADAAWGQSLEVAPVCVEMTAGAQAATLTITNRSDQTVPIQARIFSWDQNEGEDHLTQTDEMMVSPPIVQMAPGISQIIRLVLRHPPGAEEQSFRILLDQIPAPGDIGVVRFRLRLSIPVFVSPNMRATPVLAWRLENGADGADGGALVAVNSGNRYAKIVNPVLAAPDGRELTVKQNVNAYVLPGVTRRWRVEGRIAPDVPLHLTAMSDFGPIDQIVNAGAGP